MVRWVWDFWGTFNDSKTFRVTNNHPFGWDSAFLSVILFAEYPAPVSNEIQSGMRTDVLIQKTTSQLLFPWKTYPDATYSRSFGQLAIVPFCTQ